MFQNTNYNFACVKETRSYSIFKNNCTKQISAKVDLKKEVIVNNKKTTQPHWEVKDVVSLCLLNHVDAPIDIIASILGRTRAATQKKINRLKIRPSHCRYQTSAGATHTIQEIDLKFYRDFLATAQIKHSRLFCLSKVTQITLYLERHILDLKPRKSPTKPLRLNDTNAKILHRQKQLDRWMKPEELKNYLNTRNHPTVSVKNEQLLQHGFIFLLKGKPIRAYEALKIANQISSNEKSGRIYLEMCSQD